MTKKDFKVRESEIDGIKSKWTYCIRDGNMLKDKMTITEGQAKIEFSLSEV